MELQQQLDALAARVAALEKRPLPAPFRAEEFGISATAPGYDPTCEGSAYRPAAAPAPGSDAEHPPLGYRLVEPESDKLIKKGWLVWSYGTGPWSEFTPQSIGLYRSASGYAVAEPIPAAENDSQTAENRVFVPVVAYKWIPGVPPKPYASEWFFAKLAAGAPVALKALPVGHSYDYKTVDETYFSKDRVVAWMQNPDSEYIACVTDDNVQACAECAKLRDLAKRESARADAATGRAVLAERQLAELRAQLRTMGGVG